MKARDISEAACQEQPRNFLLHLLAALGNKLADEMSNVRLVLPWLNVALSNTLTGVLMLLFGGMIGALSQWLR